MDYKGRQQRLRTVLSSRRSDALLVTHLPNMRYLCGFTGSAGALLVTEGRSVLFTDGRYTEQAHREARSAQVVIARQGPLGAAASWLATHKKERRGAGAYRLGIDGEHLTVGARSRLGRLLPSNVRLHLASGLVEAARMVKDEDEIRLIRAAARLGARLFDRVLEVLRPGVAETQVAAEMEYAARSEGAEGMSFPTIVASGPRSALPHARASATPIPRRTFVVCDFGVILCGYCSDRTRTVFVGRPNGDARRVYDAVRRAQLAALAAVKPGVSANDIDQVSRKVLQKEGLAKYFTHSTGHGVGLEIHEGPRLAAGQTEVLKPGMVITIEPGVYVPGRWGVRIEDMVVVTASGCETLAPSRNELTAL